MTRTRYLQVLISKSLYVNVFRQAIGRYTGVYILRRAPIARAEMFHCFDRVRLELGMPVAVRAAAGLTCTAAAVRARGLLTRCLLVQCSQRAEHTSNVTRLTCRSVSN